MNVRGRLARLEAASPPVASYEERITELRKHCPLDNSLDSEDWSGYDAGPPDEWAIRVEARVKQLWKERGLDQVTEQEEGGRCNV